MQKNPNTYVLGQGNSAPRTVNAAACLGAAAAMVIVEAPGAVEPAVAQEPVQRKELRPRCYQLELFKEAKRRNVRWRASLSFTLLSIPHTDVYTIS